MSQPSTGRRLRDRILRRPSGVDQPLPARQRRRWRSNETPEIPNVGTGPKLTSAAEHAQGSTDDDPETDGSGRRTRSRQQRQARRRQSAFGSSLREWLHDREIAAEKRAAEARKKLAAQPRGVHRVPAQYRDQARATSWVVRHEAQPHPETGSWVKGMPYRNPDRAARLAKSGRLRTELRDGTDG